jgi:hypothetical protein
MFTPSVGPALTIAVRCRRSAWRRTRRLFKRCCGRVQVWGLRTAAAVSIRGTGSCCGIVGFVGHLGRTRLLYLGFCPTRVGSERNHVRWPGARNVVMSSSPQPILKTRLEQLHGGTLRRVTLALFTESAVFHAPRHEDFQSSCRSGTMCHHRSLLVSIQALNAGLSRSILPIRTHSGI